MVWLLDHCPLMVQALGSYLQEFDQEELYIQAIYQKVNTAIR